MRKVISLCLFMSIVLGLTIVSPTNVLSEQMNVYESKVGISVKYPESWILQDQSQYLSDSPTNIMKVSAVFYSSEDADAGSMNPAAVTVQVLDSTNNSKLTAEKMVDSGVKLTQSMMSDFEVIQPTQDMTVAGKAYKMAEVKGVGPEGNPLQSLTLCRKEGNWMIAFSYAAHPDNFETYKSQGMKIVESIE